MKIAYSQPIPTAYRIFSTGSTPASLFVNSTQDALCDGKPARKTRVSWCGGAQSLATNTRIVIDHIGTTHKPGIAALLGLSLPEGTKIQVQGRLADTVIPTTLAETRTVKLPDGSIAAWFVLPVETNADSFDFIIFNDVNGASPFTSATQFDIGEAVFMPALDANHQAQWIDDQIDTSISSRTLGGQIQTIERSSYRHLKADLTPEDVSRVRGVALANGMSWHQLRARVKGAKRCVVIPRWKTLAGAIDSNALYSTALYGVCTSFGEIQHLGGDYYTAALSFEEIPSK